jgi:hypothetical protein
VADPENPFENNSSKERIFSSAERGGSIVRLTIRLTVFLVVYFVIRIGACLARPDEHPHDPVGEAVMLGFFVAVASVVLWAIARGKRQEQLRRDQLAAWRRAAERKDK